MEDKKRNGMEFEDIYSNSDNMDFEDIFSTSEGYSDLPNNARIRSTPVSAFDESVEDAFNSLTQYKKSYELRNDYSDYADYSNGDYGDYTSRRPVQESRSNRQRQPQAYSNTDGSPRQSSRKKRPEPTEEYLGGQELYEEIPSERPPVNKRRKRKTKKRFASFVSLLLIFAAVLGIGANAFLNKMLGGVTYSEEGRKENVYVNSDNLYQSKDVTNILLLGVDRRAENEDSRSDTMMLLSVDRKNKKLKLTSFLRDSYVDIPNKGYAKLNSASTYGGADLVMDTIEYNFNVKIDNYVLVDFNMFSEIVDKLGGVEVEVTQKEADFMASKKYGAPEKPIYLKQGVNTLDGYSALWYCRIRYLDSDFFRTQRQRKVVSSIINKAKKTNVLDLLDIVKAVTPLVETGFTQNELKKIAFDALKCMSYEICQQQMPADGAWKSMTTKSGASVLSLDIDMNRKILYDFIYSKNEQNNEQESSTGQ